MKKITMALWPILTCFLITLFTGCSAQKASSDDRYAEAWQKVLRSQAWKDALKYDEPELNLEEQEDYYVSTENTVLEKYRSTSKKKRGLDFESKYDVLVRRAYLKIIAEAEEADTRLEREYVIKNAQALKKEARTDKKLDQELKVINKRYHAHRKMLKGLKSWNIFSEYGTNDLEFFKKEHKSKVREMMGKGKKESSIINYLVYKLADLYHVEA